MRRIRQETFDEAVRENEVEFGMSEEDAIRSAVSEFETQGVDLRDVIKSKTDARENLPALITWRTLQESLHESDEPGGCVPLLVRLKQQVQESDPRAETVLLLSQEGATDVVMEMMHVNTKDRGYLMALLDVLLMLLQERKNKEKFHAADGPTRSLGLWRGHLEDEESIGRIMRMISAASSKHEKNKCAFMELGIGDALNAALERRPCSLQLVKASCHVICALTSADDPEVTVSECFKFARDLVTCKVHASLIACMRVEWQALGHKDRKLLLSALRHLCVNEEICRSVSEEHGALSLAMSAVMAGMRDADLVSAAVAFLRQLAGSDRVKMLMQENNIFWLLQVVLNTHGANPTAVEYTTGLLGALYLRNLDMLALSAAEEMMERLLEIMKVQEGNGRVQRSCCMALRNMAVRNASIRNACLQRGAAMLVRSAVHKHPSLCADVGSAALRDFGLDDYMSSHNMG